MVASLIVPAGGFNPPEPTGQRLDRYLPDRRHGRTLTLRGGARHESEAFAVRGVLSER